MTDTVTDWPRAVEVLNEDGASDLVLICEHASNYIPSEYDRLGLSAGDLDRHIAWDIGAAMLTRRLSQMLDAPAFLGAYSRLLIDLNRPLDTPGSAAARSEDTDIPGNRDLDTAEMRRRADLIFHPFHDRIARHIDMRVNRNRPTRILSVHSFTPVFHGQSRPWHAGVLYDRAHAEAFGNEVLARLAEDPDLWIGANVPYGVSREGDYGVYVHGMDRGLDAIFIEIRQDLLKSADAVETWSVRLTDALI